MGNTRKCVVCGEAFVPDPLEPQNLQRRSLKRERLRRWARRQKARQPFRRGAVLVLTPAKNVRIAEVAKERGCLPADVIREVLRKAKVL